MKNIKLSQKLTESGLMLAMATILSVVKVAELPYGGSITLASMLPVIIIAYRYGVAWGSLAGFVYGLIQLLLGINVLSYATSIGAVIAIILLDYILAFTTVFLGGCFRRMQSAPLAFGCAAVTVCAMRYILHVISGCTVWAGLSIPTGDALIYSLVYNATYMIPETIVTTVAAVFVGSLLDFSEPELKPARRGNTPKSAYLLSATAGVVLLGAVTAIAALVFSHLQNADTGEFDVTGIAEVNHTAVIIIAAAAAVLAAALFCIRTVIVKKRAQ